MTRVSVVRAWHCPRRAERSAMVVLSLKHQANCLLHPLPSVFIGSIIFTGIDYGRGSVSPRRVASHFGRTFGFLFLYNAMICPMEALSERQSSLHNVCSGGILGYLGVRHGAMGVPFVPLTFFFRYPQIPPPIVGMFVYGAGAGLLAGGLGGKAM